MEPGKRKKRINYTVMVVSDSPDGRIHPFCLEQKLITAFLCIVAVVLIGSVGVALHHSSALREVQAEDNLLKDKVDELTQKNQELLTENSELSDKVAILSEKVAQDEETKVAQEKEEEEKKLPKGFPLAGPAVILESSETAMNTEEAEDTEGDEADETVAEAEPIVVFSASEGVKVIATGSGIVASVEADEAYGYRVTIDHGNGYHSIYRVASEPLVSEGDEIANGAALYELQSADEKLGYQLTKDGALIDPLDLLEVYG